MGLYENILEGRDKISLVGLGYVGMPIAVAFARKVKVIGYDLNAEKIKMYQSGIDPTNEVGNDVIRIYLGCGKAAGSKIPHRCRAHARQRRPHAGLNAGGGCKQDSGTESDQRFCGSI